MIPVVVHLPMINIKLHPKGRNLSKIKSRRMLLLLWANTEDLPGRMCVLEEQQVDTLIKKPLLKCTHKYRPSDKYILGQKYLG